MARPSEKLDATFARLRREGRAALMPYLCAGYPDLPRSLEAMAAAARAGADVIEVGIPFTDPIADGPTLQAAASAALAQGTTLRRVLDALTARPLEVPAVLMSYLNPIVRLEEQSFARAAARAGVSAVIVPDLPFDEATPLDQALEESGLHRVQLAAPTTPDDRLRALAARSRGFLYLVSTTGTTGARATLGDEVEALVGRARRAAAGRDLPLAVGFGVSTPEQAALVSRFADGVIVGSALCDRIARAQGAGNAEVANSVGSFVSELSLAIAGTAPRDGRDSLRKEPS